MKIRLAVIFGGESVEHEISIISAHQVMEAFDRQKYEIIPVYIAKNSEWYVGDVLKDITNYEDLDFIVKNAKKVKLVADQNKYFLYGYPFKIFKAKPLVEFDLAFPIVHGTNLEDGTLQGLLEANKIPYAGPNITGAAVGQDKVLMKMIWQAADLPVLPYVWFYDSQWRDLKADYTKTLKKRLGFPVIVKPANLGSSVGISIAKDEQALIRAIDEAIKYDSKIIVEQALTDFSEYNCSVLGNNAQVKASVIEQVFGSDEVLSYQDKYQGGSKGASKRGTLGTATAAPLKTSGGAKGASGMASTSRQIPAKLTKKMQDAIVGLSEVSFQTLGMSGVSRIDFLVDNKTKKIYLNEINTIPGSLAFYLWEASGVPFPQLLDELVQIALDRFKTKERMTFTYDTNILAQQAQFGTKGDKK
jgi:D-alanine-D-alanine ligase